MFLDSTFQYEFFYGEEIKKNLAEFAELRMKVFREYPYLYDGEMAYEEEYLKTYLEAKSSLVILVFYEQKCIGATSCVWLKEEVDDLKNPIIKAGLNPDNYLYFGESLVLGEFRKQGLGKKFFELRLEHFKKLVSMGYPLKASCFCSVIRDSNHPQRPKNYKALDSFWSQMGFYRSSIECSFTWKDLGEKKETRKLMSYYFNHEKHH